MRTAIVCGIVAALATIAVAAGVATAKPPAPNGLIAFARFNPSLGDTQVYVINPDGTHERLVQGPDQTGECPTWFPDGSRIAICGSPALPNGGSRFINPENGSFRDVGGSDPSLFNPCFNPSPDGSLLLCETFGSTDTSSNGIHLARTTDGATVGRVTSNPGGDDVPEDWSPDGRRIVFQRFEASGAYDGIFMINIDGTGLKQVVPPSVAANCCIVSWSPGDELLFTQHVTPDSRSSMWVVHTDGTGLRQVNVRPTRTCGGSTVDPSAQGCPQAVWSPDGKKILFARGQNLDVDGQLYLVNPDGTGLVQVTHTPAAQSPSWGIHPLIR